MINISLQIQQSSELIFVDSPSSIDEHSMQVFIFCTRSVAVTLPIGIVITSDEHMETLTETLILSKSLFPNNRVFGKGRPDVIMTDNCSELREALYKVFPELTLLLCIFYILQQVWRWLFDKKYGLSANDKLDMMRSFGALVHAKEVDYFEELLRQFFVIPSFVKYPAAVLYFTELGTLTYKSLKIYCTKFVLLY